MRRVLDVTEAPVALSHSNAYSLCDHPRNAPDDVLRRLKDNGGLVMATFVPGFVSQPLRDWLRRSRDAYGKAPLAADPEGAVRRTRGQARHRAQGEPRNRSPTTSSGWSRPPASITSGSARTISAALRPSASKTSAAFPHLFAELVRRGFSERDLAKMSSANVLRVLRRVEAVGKRLRKTRPPAIGRIEDYPGA